MHLEKLVFRVFKKKSRVEYFWVGTSLKGKAILQAIPGNHLAKVDIS